MAMLRALPKIVEARFANIRWLRTLQPVLQKTAFAEDGSPRIAIAEDGKKLKLAWKGDREWSFHSMWLRHNCRCRECLSPHGQKTAALEHSFRKGVSTNFKIGSVYLEGENREREREREPIIERGSDGGKKMGGKKRGRFEGRGQAGGKEEGQERGGREGKRSAHTLQVTTYM